MLALARLSSGERRRGQSILLPQPGQPQRRLRRLSRIAPASCLQCSDARLLLSYTGATWRLPALEAATGAPSSIWHRLIMSLESASEPNQTSTSRSALRLRRRKLTEPRAWCECRHRTVTSRVPESSFTSTRRRSSTTAKGCQLEERAAQPASVSGLREGADGPGGR